MFCGAYYCAVASCVVPIRGLGSKLIVLVRDGYSDSYSTSVEICFCLTHSRGNKNILSTREVIGCEARHKASTFSHSVYLASADNPSERDNLRTQVWGKPQQVEELQLAASEIVGYCKSLKGATIEVAQLERIIRKCCLKNP